ncbi:MAG TPA: thioredoxin domain-containing protein [Bryobacteraceae bacterium]|nr:thioredoxin domain-containing protein [Bryobacteraceae bacterium]
MDRLELNRDENWVDVRLRTLNPPQEWKPNSAASRARIRRREHTRRVWARSWAWTAATICVAALVSIGVPAPAKCAVLGLGCPNVAPAVQKGLPVPVAATNPTPVSSAPAKSVANPSSPHISNYKELGSPSAPLVCEIYSDYECPSCANFYRTVYPALVSEYVKVGKLRIIHRDFPLPQHPYAILAAQYANAAGELGHYEQVAAQLFATQQNWSQNGNVAGSVAQVLPPGVMQKLRAMVESATDPQATMRNDQALAAQGDIYQTPSLVFIKSGARNKIAGAPAWAVLKLYINELLNQ